MWTLEYLRHDKGAIAKEYIYEVLKKTKGSYSIILNKIKIYMDQEYLLNTYLSTKMILLKIFSIFWRE